jgi:hypothetical protein
MIQTLGAQARPPEELTAGDGEVVIVAGIEHHGEPRHSWIPLHNFFDAQADPGDDLERLELHSIALHSFCGSLSGVWQAVEEHNGAS